MEKKFIVQNFIKDMGYNKFVISHFIELIVNEFGFTKAEIYKAFNQLKSDGVIERKFESTECKTLCSSCYEYGCDREQTPPVSYWVFR